MSERKPAYILFAIVLISLAWLVWTFAHVMWTCGWMSAMPGHDGFPAGMFSIYVICFAVLGFGIVLAVKQKPWWALILMAAAAFVETIFWFSMLT